MKPAALSTSYFSAPLWSVGFRPFFIAEKWSGLFEQIFLIYKWKTCGFTLPLGPLAATR